LAQRFGVVTDFTFFRADEEGDLELVYSDVPTDAVGATAVDTSASISGYAASETTGASVDSAVRYFQDRNFPKRGGYHTDSRLASIAHPKWIDVHFGSELYFDLVRTEARYSLNGFASIAGDLKFEHLGRHFRITDPNRQGLAVLPDETADVAAPEWLPDSRTTTRVQLREERRTPKQELDSRLEALASPPATCAVSNAYRHVKEPWAMAWPLVTLLLGLGRRGRRRCPAPVWHGRCNWAKNSTNRGSRKPCINRNPSAIRRARRVPKMRLTWVHAPGVLSSLARVETAGQWLQWPPHQASERDPGVERWTSAQPCA
jgi:hypothetical protein